VEAKPSPLLTSCGGITGILAPASSETSPEQRLTLTVLAHLTCFDNLWEFAASPISRRKSRWSKEWALYNGSFNHNGHEMTGTADPRRTPTSVLTPVGARSSDPVAVPANTPGFCASFPLRSPEHILRRVLLSLSVGGPC